MRKQSLRPLPKLKHKAEALFHKYVCKRDHYICYTCGKEGNQAGHYWHNKLDFDERNLHCQCLTKDSSLLISDGTKKTIKDIVPGDNLQSFNSKTFKKEHAIVISTESFMPTELYEVTLEDGSKFKATADHRVVANGKWVSIKEMLHDPSTYDILEYDEIV